MSFPIVSEPIDKIKMEIPTIFENAVEKHAEFRGELTLYIRKEEIFNVCKALKEHPILQFDYLSDLTAVDNLNDQKEGEARFYVVYHLFSTKTKRRLRLKASVDGENPTISSVTPIWCGANWHERECYDMFGIHFEGHPDMRRILMPEDWEGYPLRKDYPVADQEPYEYINKQLADE